MSPEFNASLIDIEHNSTPSRDSLELDIFCLKCSTNLLRTIEKKVPFKRVKKWISKKQENIADLISAKREMFAGIEAQEFLNRPTNPNDGKWVYEEYTHVTTFGDIESARTIFPELTDNELLKVQRRFCFSYHNINLIIHEDLSSSMGHSTNALIEDLEYVRTLKDNEFLKKTLKDLLDPRSLLN